MDASNGTLLPPTAIVAKLLYLGAAVCARRCAPVTVLAVAFRPGADSQKSQTGRSCGRKRACIGRVEKQQALAHMYPHRDHPARRRRFSGKRISAIRSPLCYQSVLYVIQHD